MAPPSGEQPLHEVDESSIRAQIHRLLPAAAAAPPAPPPPPPPPPMPAPAPPMMPTPPAPTELAAHAGAGALVPLRGAAVADDALHRLRHLISEQRRLYEEQVRQVDAAEAAAAIGRQRDLSRMDAGVQAMERATAEELRRVAAQGSDALSRAEVEQARRDDALRRDAAEQVEAALQERNAALDRAGAAAEQLRAAQRAELLRAEAALRDAAEQQRREADLVSARGAEAQAAVHTEHLRALSEHGGEAEQRADALRIRLDAVGGQAEVERARLEQGLAALRAVHDAQCSERDAAVTAIAAAQRELARRQAAGAERLRDEQAKQTTRGEEALRRVSEELAADGEARLHIQTLQRTERELRERIAEQQRAMQQVSAEYEGRAEEQRQQAALLREAIRQREAAATEQAAELRACEAALHDRDAVTLPALRAELQRQELAVLSAAAGHEKEAADLRARRDALRESVDAGRREGERLSAELVELHGHVSEHDRRAAALREQIGDAEARAGRAVAEAEGSLRPAAERWKEEAEEARAAQHALRRRLRQAEAAEAAAAAEREAAAAALARQNDDLRLVVAYLSDELRGAQRREHGAAESEAEHRRSIERTKERVRRARREAASNEEAAAAVAARNAELEELHPAARRPLPAAAPDAGALRPPPAAADDAVVPAPLPPPQPPLFTPACAPPLPPPAPAPSCVGPFAPCPLPRPLA